MNQPWVYTCSPSWNPLPRSSPYHPSGSSQCTSPKHSILLCCCRCCWVTSIVSDSVQPHRWQPIRLPHPWTSSGKNTGVGCHFLLQWMKVKSESEVAQLCPTPRPHVLQPTRLLYPWDFPGKSTGVGRHCLLCYIVIHLFKLYKSISFIYMVWVAEKWSAIHIDHIVMFSSVVKLCPTLCNPMDCSKPGFPVLHQLLELI